MAASPECTICFERYGRKRLPKLLPCGHSFCLLCLVEVHERNNSRLPCPLCKKVSKSVPANLTTVFALQGDAAPAEAQVRP